MRREPQPEAICDVAQSYELATCEQPLHTFGSKAIRIEQFGIIEWFD